MKEKKQKLSPKKINRRAKEINVLFLREKSAQSRFGKKKHIIKSGMRITYYAGLRLTRYRHDIFLSTELISSKMIHERFLGGLLRN